MAKIVFQPSVDLLMSFSHIRFFLFSLRESIITVSVSITARPLMPSHLSFVHIRLNIVIIDLVLVEWAANSSLPSSFGRVLLGIMSINHSFRVEVRVVD